MPAELAARDKFSPVVGEVLSHCLITEAIDCYVMELKNLALVDCDVRFSSEGAAAAMTEMR